MGVEVVCNIIYFGVYGNPTITVTAMLLQIMDTKGLGPLGRHDDTRTDEYRSIYRTNKMDINGLHSSSILSGNKMEKRPGNEKDERIINVSKKKKAIGPTQKDSRSRQAVSVPR